jgi:hypothetical protein
MKSSLLIESTNQKDASKLRKGFFGSQAGGRSKLKNLEHYYNPKIIVTEIHSVIVNTMYKDSGK